jgi:hypothetical protein
VATPGGSEVTAKGRFRAANLADGARPFHKSRGARINFVDLPAQNLPAAKKFYASVFG